MGSRLANALASYAVYLGKSLWPTGLAVYYPHPALVSGGASVSAATWAGGAALMAGTGGGLRLRRRRPYAAVGWLWYLGMLVPVIGILQVGMQARADRYAYLPLIGIYVALAWAAGEIGSRRPRTA